MIWEVKGRKLVRITWAQLLLEEFKAVWWGLIIMMALVAATLVGLLWCAQEAPA